MPGTLKLAVSLLVLYGLTGLAQVVLLGIATEWVDRVSLVKEASRLVLTLLLAWGLLTRRGWAWWVAVVATGAFGVLAAVAFAGLFGFGGRGASLTSVGGVMAMVVLFSLIGAFVLLVLPQSRRAF